MQRNVTSVFLGVVTMAAAVVASLWVAVPPTMGEGVRPCKTEAKREYRECKGECKEAYRFAKDMCFKIDDPCVDDCQLARHQCATPIRDARDAAIAVCDAALAGDKAACRATFGDGTPERDQCIDDAQLVAFICRDNAREAARPALKACRADFKDCVRASCPPDAPVDREAAKQCKRDAKDIYKDCRQNCRDELQLARDACLDRDHDCVEACRVERTDCRAPLLAQRDTAIDACNAARATAIAACKQDFEPGTKERDTCIDTAQIAAFRCRDDAREAVRPDLKVCRQDFLACARACPPTGSPSGAFLDAAVGVLQ